MRLRGLAPIVLAALLLAPAAMAGSSRRPEIEDARDPTMAPSLDVVKAWIEAQPDGLRFFVQTVAGPPSDVVHWFGFHVEATGEEVAAAVGYGNDGVLRGHLAEDGDLRDLRASIRPGFEQIADGGLVGMDRTGATLSALIPWGSAPGLHEGAQLHGLSAGTLRFDRGGSGWQPGDTASADEIVVAAIPSPLARMSAGILPILVPAWVLPLLVVSCTLAGAGAGLAIARRAKRETQIPLATPVPVRAPLPPPGRRFRAMPPARPR